MPHPRPGRMGGEGQHGWGVLLVASRWLRSLRYRAPQAVADKTKREGGEKGQGGWFGGGVEVQGENRAIAKGATVCVGSTIRGCSIER